MKLKAIVCALFLLSAASASAEAQPWTTMADESPTIAYCGEYKLTITDEGNRALVDGKEYFADAGQVTEDAIVETYISSDSKDVISILIGKVDHQFSLILTNEQAPQYCTTKPM